VNKRD